MSGVISKAQTLAEKASSVAIYGGAGMATLSVSEWCQIAGVIFAFFGLLYNVYHKEKMLKELKNKSVVSLKDD